MVVCKNDVIPIVKWLAVDLYEVIIDIRLPNNVFFHTIEWRKKENRVLLHRIISNIDFEYDFDEFDDDTKKEIYLFLVRNYLN